MSMDMIAKKAISDRFHRESLRKPSRDGHAVLRRRKRRSGMENASIFADLEGHPPTIHELNTPGHYGKMTGEENDSPAAIRFVPNG
jgi:hypothetical protein